MYSKCLCILLLIPTFLVASPDQSVRRVQAYLLIGDMRSALCEVEKGMHSFPEDPLVYLWAIKSFAVAGKEDEMMRVWGRLHELYPEKSLEQNLLEEMCWGILRKGKETAEFPSQLIAIIGAALTQDVRALPFLLDGMRHPNAQIREISVELAAHYGDYPLRHELGSLFRHESVLNVRLTLFKALGKLQMEEFLPDLVQCVANAKNGPREKSAAIEAIVQMRASVTKEELEVLALSQRAGLRELACEVIAHCDLIEQSSLLIPLVQDCRPEVCAAALRTWGLLRKELTPNIQKLALEALDPEVGITAAWVWLITHPEEGEKAMMKWLKSDRAHVRALAASAVAKAGSYGVALARNVLESTDDLYVKLNLALALAGQRESNDYVCSILEESLGSHDKWMFSENMFFKTIEKSKLSHKPSIPNAPEVINQTIRLEILNILAILESPNALKAIKEFLKNCKWEVTGLAAETLLGEGDEHAIDLVRELLLDPDKEIRLEAALALATWGKDYSAVSTLLEVYPNADRQLKIKILESLSRIGDKKAVLFLIERLREPSLLIRMIAASVLIQILNH